MFYTAKLQYKITTDFISIRYLAAHHAVIRKRRMSSAYQIPPVQTERNHRAVDVDALHLASASADRARHEYQGAGFVCVAECFLIHRVILSDED